MSARLSVLLLLLCPSLAFAQPANTVAQTVRTTNTTATSLCVGSSTTACSAAAGGIKAGDVDVATVTSGGFIGIANNVPISTTMRLYNNAGTLSWNGSPLSIGGSTVSGTIGKLAKFTGAAAVGDSICSESGTTITCVNTVSATTLTGTLSTAVQPNVTTMAGLVSVGTITTGVWTGTAIGLAKGGTNADLSATGGTSNFLRQNTVGGTISVIRPAVADLSDASNVALLNVNNAFTGSGVTTFTGSGNGGHGVSVVNTTSNTLAYALLKATAGTTVAELNAFSQGYTTSTWDVQAGAALSGTGAGGLSVVASHASGAIRFYAGGTAIRWGINAAGDFTLGPSAKIADSSGTPTCGAGCSGIAGTDYAFRYADAGGAVINFGHTWSTAPVCVANSETVTMPGSHFRYYAVVTTTTTATVAFNGDLAGGGNGNVSILCRSY